MNEKKNFSKRTNNGERRNDRNTFKEVKEFASSCDTVGRNEELEQSKNITRHINDNFSLATDQFRLSELGDVTSSKFIENRSFKTNSNFSRMRTNSDSDSMSSRGSCAEKSDVSPTPKSSRTVRHLPFRTISQETIANISRRVRKLKEVMNTGHGSTSAIAGNSSSMITRKKENKPNAIILPKEHFQVLQERIRTEIENLKYLEAGDSKQEERKTNGSDSDDDVDVEELGSDIQYLSAKQREKLERKFKKLKHDGKKSKETKDAENQSLSQDKKPIIMIDLTKESTPSEVIEKTEIETESDFPSLDLDYGSKINWDDGEKHSKDVKHSTVYTVCEKPVINLDLDESKLTVETTKKIEDIKNRLGRSLSIGLTHKEAEKEFCKETVAVSNVINVPGAGGSEMEGSSEDAEALELASLRCTSERTEVIADRERRRQRRCADYPGLAFGFSIFSSDTMMKFSIIRNELHNIMNTQLKRVCTYYV